MDESIQNEIREIKKSFRLSMNGVVSTLQRRQGLDYKINFGVEVPRLKGIAEGHSKNTELATALWQDNIRECKMLAIFLMPKEGYSDVAEKWIGETRFTEIADQLAMHILCHLPDAAEKALQWIRHDEEMFRYCGYRTISHLLRRGVIFSKQQEESFYDSLVGMPDGELSVTAKCAHNAVMNYMDYTAGAAIRLREAIEKSDSDAIMLKALLESFDKE